MPATISDPAVAPSDIDDYIDGLREAIGRDGGRLSTAVGIVVGAASACWTNLRGAGEFRSDHAAALVDLLLSYVLPDDRDRGTVLRVKGAPVDLEHVPAQWLAAHGNDIGA